MDCQAHIEGVQSTQYLPIKLAIVDDRVAVRRVVRSFIESHTDWEICGEAGDGEAAIVIAERLNPDPHCARLFDASEERSGCSTHDRNRLPEVRNGPFHCSR